ncbi:MAG: hypothetical protein ACO1OB_08905 [Archangium sp.]
MRRLALLASLCFVACLDQTPPETAPEEVDANLKWFWVNGDDAEDALLVDGAAKLAVSGKADTRTEPLKGQMRNRLESGDLTKFGLEANDPSAARGVILVNLFDCSLDKLETILSAKDQKAQYAGVYESYDRTFTTSDPESFNAKRDDRINWDIAMRVALPLGDIYDSNVKGGLRRVKGGEKGDFIIARTYLTAPATFMNPNTTSYFKQDYQIEVFWEQSPGRIFHAYGMWREIKTYDLTIEDNGFLNIVLDNLKKWDDGTQDLCRK